MSLLCSGATCSISLSKVFESFGDWSSMNRIRPHPSCIHVYNLLLPPFKNVTSVWKVWQHSIERDFQKILISNTKISKNTNTNLAN